MDNRQNKQRFFFIFMLSEELQKNCETHHASRDVDFLIVLKAVQSATTTSLVLVGDDSHFVLFCYHGSLESL